MRCRIENIELEGRTVHAVLCTSGRRFKKCDECQKSESQFQCDFPLNRDQAGKIIRTCDRHLCDKCVRHGKTKGIDFCREHYPLAKAAYERKLKKGMDLLYG